MRPSRRFRHSSLPLAVAVTLFVGLLAPMGADAIPAGAPRRPQVDPRVWDAAASNASVPVIVEFADEVDPTQSAQSTQDRTNRVLARMPPGSIRHTTTFDRLPMVAIEVDRAGLDALATDPGVARVVPNGRKRASLAQSTVKIGAPTLWNNPTPITGAGQTIAILDTGVSAAHPFLGGKVVAEGCFSSSFGGSTAICPGPDPTTATGTGSGGPCPAFPDCNHGTHVAGIAAGGTAGAAGTFAGVAPGASLIAVDVFSTFTSATDCSPSPAPCALAWDDSIIRGLDYIFSLRNTYTIAAVNLSLGGGGTFGYCDNDPEKPAIDQLRSVGIVTVAASGNDATMRGKNIISSPACISSVVSVAATDDVNDTVPAWVQTSAFLTLFAPGLPIVSSVARAETFSGPCPAPFSAGQCATYRGTSMATPHAAGAMALVRQFTPGISVPDSIALLRNTGVQVFDQANGISAPRIALDAVVSPPTFHPVTPTRILDTRSGIGTGGIPGAVFGGTNVTFPVIGLAGIPSSGVSAVVLNVTSVFPSATSFVTAYPTGSLRPLASNLNLTPPDTRANLVIVKVGGGGRVSLFNNTGAVHLVADLAGWFDLGGVTATGAHYAPNNPARILDTRDGTGIGGVPTRVGPSSTITIDATSRCLGTGTVRAVTINVAAISPSADSHVTVWPAGQPKPDVSNLNFSTGSLVPNLVVVPVSAAGQVSLFNNAGSVDLIADLQGCFLDGTGSLGSVVSTDPTRTLDTRFGVGAAPGPVGPGATITLQVAGRAGVPASGVVAVMLNVTVTEPTATSHLTVWPAGQLRPIASNLNFVAGQTAPNLVFVQLNASGQASIFNNSGSTQVIADVFGYVTS